MEFGIGGRRGLGTWHLKYCRAYIVSGFAFTIGYTAGEFISTLGIVSEKYIKLQVIVSNHIVSHTVIDLDVMNEPINHQLSA